MGNTSFSNNCFHPKWKTIWPLLSSNATDPCWWY